MPYTTPEDVAQMYAEIAAQKALLEYYLLAATGTEYGRVMDIELVTAVQRIAGDGVGQTRWKVPGVIDWSTSRYNPFVDPTLSLTGAKVCGLSPKKVVL